jgi:hypothetical protein
MKARAQRGTRQALVSWVDDIAQAAEFFVQDVDNYFEDKTVPLEDLQTLRSWQSRLTRLMTDLNTLRRRLDE